MSFSHPADDVFEQSPHPHETGGGNDHDSASPSRRRSSDGSTSGQRRHSRDGGGARASSGHGGTGSSTSRPRHEDKANAARDDKAKADDDKDSGTINHPAAMEHPSMVGDNVSDDGRPLWVPAGAGGMRDDMHGRMPWGGYDGGMGHEDNGGVDDEDDDEEVVDDAEDDDAGGLNGGGVAHHEHEGGEADDEQGDDNLEDGVEDAVDVVTQTLRKTGKRLRPPKPSGKLPDGAVATAVRFDRLGAFQEHDPDAAYRGDPSAGTANGKRDGNGDDDEQEEGPMLVETSDSDTEDDMHSTNTVGKIPAHWYDDEEHVGYDLDGKKITKSGREKDRLDKFLQKIDDPDYGRTIVDPLTKKEIVLTDEEVDMIKRIQGGEFPDSKLDPYEDYIDFFTYEKRVTPLSNAPEPKRRFTPSKHEHKLVMRIVRGLRKGWLKPKPKEEDSEETEFYDIWKNAESTGPGRKALVHISAPKVALPGHAESYNPPVEYLPTEEEVKEWEEMDPEDRPRDFLPKRYSSLRLVPAYPRFLQERFSRCLDLYLCPRTIKHRINVDPESLIPTLPKPDDLRPFPAKQSIVYRGHTDRVTCLSVDPTGRWLLTGSEDKTVSFWEVRNGRRTKVIALPEEVTAVAWCPNPSFTVAAIAFGTTVWLVNPGLGSRQCVADTDEALATAVDSQGRASAVEWQRASPTEFKQDGLRFVLRMKKEVTQVAWHAKGNYFASVSPDGVADSVAVHSLLRRHSAYHFKKGRDVQRVAFHPSKPLFFLATKTHVRVYNLQTNTLVKRLSSGAKWISSIAVHPQGDNVIVGTLDRRLCWFDMDLSTKPYKTLRYHALALRAVAFHNRQPLFASAGDDGNVHVFHGMVYSDLMQNPLLVPVKILRGHAQDSAGLGVLDCCFHPSQPWLFSAGADGTARLFTDA
eukprot:m.120230 g.120230  ORF g.120230 m.120230 type:complete len:915 (-) comp11050_c0_seq5:125-2869(-)